MPASPLPRLRQICLALPNATEVEAWGEPTFRCGKIFAMYASGANHHGGGRDAVWLKAAPGNQAYMVRSDPDRFFVPPYVGPAGWIGVRLDKRPPWKEITALVEESWRLIAPKKLVAAHAASHAAAPSAKPRRGATPRGSRSAAPKRSPRPRSR